MSEKLKVGVIFGGRSGEHEVSLASARSVLAQINPASYEVIQIGITPQGAWLAGLDALEAFQEKNTARLTRVALLPDPSAPGLYALRQDSASIEFYADIDVYFPVLHGTFGEDGTLQGLFEMAGAAYVGAGVTGSAVGMDKGVFKAVMQAIGVPVIESVVILRSELDKDLQLVIQRITALGAYPLFVKPANLGSSVGITKCRTRSDLVEGLLEAARFDRRIIVERGIEAREIEVSVLGNDEPQVSLPGEIVPAGDFYSYEAKYQDDRSQLLIPAPISAELAHKVQQFAVQAYRAVDCAGMARVDFLLDKNSGALYLNEINTIPGFTQISMYPKLWEASGLPYASLLDQLIALALERKQQRDRIEHHR